MYHCSWDIFFTPYFRPWADSPEGQVSILDRHLLETIKALLAEDAFSG